MVRHTDWSPVTDQIKMTHDQFKVFTANQSYSESYGTAS